METKKLRITDIEPAMLYDGYLWWSDKTTPDVYKHEKLPEWNNQTNPFIIEGQLINKSKSISWSIRFVDGDYLVKRYDLAEFEKNTTDKKLKFIEKQYLANRLDGLHKLCFKEFWRPIEDDLCEGMEVLMPAETVFIGFTKSMED